MNLSCASTLIFTVWTNTDKIQQIDQQYKLTAVDCFVIINTYLHGQNRHRDFNPVSETFLLLNGAFWLAFEISKGQNKPELFWKPALTTYWGLLLKAPVLQQCIDHTSTNSLRLNVFRGSDCLQGEWKRRNTSSNFRLIFLRGRNTLKTLHALVSLQGFIFSCASVEIYLIAASSSPMPSIMREYFPRVWKQIQALLLETLLNQAYQLFLCLPSFWWLRSHLISPIDVNGKWIFGWVSDQRRLNAGDNGFISSSRVLSVEIWMKREALEHWWQWLWLRWIAFSYKSLARVQQGKNVFIGLPS